MAHFSFGKFFGKSPRQPRFNPAPPEGARGGTDANEVLPVGRLVSFTDDGPEDAPLFQELEAPPASPFAVVGGTRASGATGGLPGPARVSMEEGFTADELTAMVPPSCVQLGAVPANQVIPLPLPVLRASLAAGQPAVLLSQLHQACPALFRAPSSLDQDLVIALPPQKVQRLVARAEASGTGLNRPLVPPIPPVAPADLSPVGWSGQGPSAPTDDAPPSAFGSPGSKIKLPPPRRKFDDMHGGDLRPLVDRHDFPPSTVGGSFSDLAQAPESAGLSGAATPSFPSPFHKPAPSSPGTSPFQVSSALPQGQPSRGGFPKRFESPFAIVSAGEVPSVLESPFARHPVAGFDQAPDPPAAQDHAPLSETPATVSLRLSALLHGQNAGTLGFEPERVPASVRVTLATTPLLMQVPTGRIRVRLDEVVAGLDAKYQPAFKNAQPGLELHVPLRELFDNLPESAPPTPAAPPVPTAFETPFSIRAEEDTSLTPENSPFQLAPRAVTEPRPESVLPPPATPSPVSLLPTLPTDLLSAHPDTGSVAPPPVAAPDSFLVIPTAPAPAPAPAPVSAAMTEVPATPPAPSPFLIIPTDTAEPPAPPAPPAPSPSLAPEIDAARRTAPPPVAHAADAIVAPPSEPPPALAAPPSQIPLPAPLRNPFSVAPGDGIRAGMGFEFPMRPYDEDPVPLESLREEEPSYRVPPALPPSPVAPPPTTPAVVPQAPALPVPPSSPDESVAAEAPPPAIALPTVPPALPPLLFVESPAEPADRNETPIQPAIQPAVVAPTPPVRIALSEREPMPPPAESAFEIAAESLTPPAVPPASPAPSPFLETGSFQLPPLPFEILGNSASSGPDPAPAVSSFVPPPAEQPPAEVTPFLPPSLADAPPFTVAAPRPTDDDRAAFASVFAPSALARTPDGTRPPLGEMDSVPAITLAKLPPITEAPAAPPAPMPPLFAIPEPVAPAELVATAPPAEPAAAESPAETSDVSSPDVSLASPALDPAPALAPAPAFVEDLSFGYVDNPTQLALRAVFATDRTLGTQEVVDLAAQLDGLRACLVHTPHASLHNTPSPDDSEDVRHFRERAGALFEKTASLVRELDPSAREQSFTLRTGKSVVSFFAIDDVCLAVLHAEPSFRPGVREKLTLVVRSVADMLSA